jgi:hypothetical protein
LTADGRRKRPGLRNRADIDWRRAAGDRIVLWQHIRYCQQSCGSPVFGATLVHIVPAGTYNADTNPSRITRCNLFDVALGSNSALKKDHYSLGGKLTVVNLMNKVALYDFLSSFSGTHFITPRTLEAELTFHF